jgi:hypothetical protein
MNKKAESLFFYAVGILFLLGFFTLQVFALFRVIPAENLSMINGIQETLKNGVILILGYFYGSSRGSFMKSQKSGEVPPGSPGN